MQRRIEHWLCSKLMYEYEMMSNMKNSLEKYCSAKVSFE